LRSEKHIELDLKKDLASCETALLLFLHEIDQGIGPVFGQTNVLYHEMEVPLCKEEEHLQLVELPFQGLEIEFL